MKTEPFKLGPIQQSWLKELRESPERQMKKYLGQKVNDDNFRACILGQLGLSAGVLSFDQDGILRDGEQANLLTHSWLKLGLRSSGGMVLGGRQYMSLSEMNDDGMTWPEIADYVEANPENVFTKSY